jgi:hypothetical protein
LRAAPHVAALSLRARPAESGEPFRITIAPQRPDCVAGHVGLEVRRETGKEQVVQVHYDEGVGAARLAAILAGESPVSRGVQSLL